MDIEDIILIILLVASVTFNICMYYRNKWLAYKLEKAKRKYLSYRADAIKQEAERLIANGKTNNYKEIDKNGVHSVKGGHNVYAIKIGGTNENNKRKNETK